MKGLTRVLGLRIADPAMSGRELDGASVLSDHDLDGVVGGLARASLPSTIGGQRDDALPATPLSPLSLPT